MATLQPVVVAYCPVCGIPPEFCEYNAACSASGRSAPTSASAAETSAAAATAAVEQGVAAVSLGGEGGGGGAQPPPAGEGDAGGGSADKAEGDAGGEAKKKGGKKVVKKQLVIERAVRNKRKCVTTVRGLDLFGVKLADAAKKFGKKFACGASVVKDAAGKEEIDVQGDYIDEMRDYIVATFPECKDLGDDDVKLVDKEKK